MCLASARPKPGNLPLGIRLGIRLGIWLAIRLVIRAKYHVIRAHRLLGLMIGP